MIEKPNDLPHYGGCDCDWCSTYPEPANGEENARRSAAACSRFVWTGDLADDCFLRVGEWFAHAECMTDDVKVRCDGEKWKEECWFLGVYRGDAQIFHSSEPSGRITSGEMARAIAEAIIGENDQVELPPKKGVDSTRDVTGG